MPHTFDATLKDLARAHPAGFVAAFDQATTLPLSLLNVDLSAITSAADFVVGLGDPLQEILHLDFQASASAAKHRDILVYNAILHKLHVVPVHSIVVLLRPQAAHSNMNGTVRYAARPAHGKMGFDYQIIRLWETPAEALLSADIGTVPLAPLGQLPSGVSHEDGLAEIIRRVVERLIRDAPPEQTNDMLTASFLLSGLRISPEVARHLFQGARAMRESSTYMAIYDEGMEKGVKGTIMRLGRKRFGAPSELVQSKLEAIHDVDQLQALADRLLDVSSWDELFAE